MAETIPVGHFPPLPSPKTVLPRAKADIRLRAVAARGESFFQERFSSQPYRLLVPTPAVGEPLTAVMANLSGGMLNGDLYRAQVKVEAGAEALVTGQAAEKLYKAADPRPIRVENTLVIEERASLEWVPQGSIQFDAARLDRVTAIEAKANSRVLAGEILHFGRAAMGETLASGYIRDIWTVTIDGELVWQDRLLLDDRTWGALTDPAGLDGAEATGLLLLSCPEAASLIDLVRQQAEHILPSQGVKFGATGINGLLICRWLGHNAQAMRQHFGAVAGFVRHAVMDRPQALPRIWNI